MKKLMIVTAVLVLTACAPIKLATPDRNAAVKEFPLVAGKAQLYVCRDGRLIGSALRPEIALDNYLPTHMATSTFIYQEIEPGDHVLKSKMPVHDSVFQFKTLAGEQRFFQVWPSYGGVFIIDEIDARTGKACVTAGRLLESEPG